MVPTVVGHDQDAAKHVTCKNCGSIIEYYQYEVTRIKHSYDYLGDYSIDSGIKCPKCDHNVFVK